MIKIKRRKPRIFMGVNEVAGYYRALEHGFRTHGFQAEFFNFFPHAFQYRDAKRERFIVKLIVSVRQRINKPGEIRGLDRLNRMNRLLSWCFLLWAAWRFDVFIFGYKTGIFTEASPGFTYRELPLLKRWGKKIIYVYHGSDSRPPYLDGSWADLDSNRLLIMTKEAKRAIVEIGRYADYIVDHPPVGFFQERRFVHWLHMGLPCMDLGPADSPTTGDPPDGKRAAVRIVHAPSNPRPKGTPQVRQAISELIEEGWKIEYYEMVGLPNAEVLNALRSADFVIDQVFSDSPLAGLATEAAWFGKPTVVCGQELDRVVAELPPDLAPPSLYGRPEALKSLVQDLIEDPTLRVALGRKAQAFVRNHWSASAVAGRYLRLVSDDVPDAWWFDPATTPYRYGYGTTREKRDEIVQGLVALGGRAALCLGDKPEVEMNVLGASLETLAMARE